MEKSIGRLWLSLVLAFALLDGCAGGTSTLTPPHLATGTSATATPVGASSAKPTATPSAKPAAGPTATGSPSANSTAAAINAALTASQTYFETLPHQNLSSDLAATAKYMVSSGQFATATVATGGIAATFPNGMPAVLFADRPEEVGPSAATFAQNANSSVARAVRERSVPRRLATTGGNANFAFFVDDVDPSGAFHPSRQTAYATAIAGGFSGYSSNYKMTLENIVAIGKTPLDFLSISTHGMVASEGSPAAPTLVLGSTTAITDTALATYAADSAAGRLFAGATLTNLAKNQTYPSFGFSIAFLTAHMAFNKGSIVDNASCFGQESTANVATFAALSGAGVGTYLGWTQPVNGNDSDQTDAFIIDRLLGSGSATALAAYVTQRNPEQRPFELSDILQIVGSETRSGPLETESYDYDVSPAGTDGFAQSDFIASTTNVTDDDTIEPSIETIAVNEGSPSTLRLAGEFPSIPGAVSDTVAGGTAVNLPVQSWTATQIVVTLPSGNAAASTGAIAVSGPASGPGNGVPLTYWHGNLSYNETATEGSFGGVTGSGTGTLAITFDVGIRADVEPVVTTIDASPVPQNLYVANVTPDSSGTIQKYSGSFASSDGTQTASVSFNAPVSFGAFASPSSIGLMSSLNQNGTSAPCNNEMSGPQGSLGNVACPGFTFDAAGVGSCTDNQNGSLCGTAASYGATIGSPSTSYGDDGDFDGQPSLIELSMDPTSYAITFSATKGVTYDGDFSDYDSATDMMSGTFDAPISPPAFAESTQSERRQPSTARVRPRK